ncbi:MFS general substrate transporter [Lactarius psammicola]|nr:MFS general substrate transporter [Lactarius psammicola]
MPDKVSIDPRSIDTGAHLVAGISLELNPQESLRIGRKIDRHIMPLMCSEIQYMDKSTLGSSAILGIQKATRLTANEYVLVLGTIFYLSYLAFEFPQNLALQRFPVGKWLRRVARNFLNILIWGIAVCCHAACTNFAGLLAVRFVLGMCEGSITAGFMIITSMFYTRKEQAARVSYWFSMNGVAIIASGFTSFGALHIHAGGLEPWQWFMIITGMLTVIAAALFYFLFPDSPTDAWFLTVGERVKAVQRLKENQAGVENKHFKIEQSVPVCIPPLTDPKTFLFALIAIFFGVTLSLINQRQIITSSFGFSPLQTTLLSCVDGVVLVVAIFTGIQVVSRVPDSISWVGIASFVPSILGVLLVSLLPWHNKVGLLFAIWLTNIGGPGFILALAWVSQTTAGHTKRVTTNAIILSAYCIGNAAGPLMWKAQYKPRNHVPWVVIGFCYAACMLLLFSIRVLLSRENRRRDECGPDTTYDDVYIMKTDERGNSVAVIVSKEFLDLTDRQNRDFRYVL